MTQPHERLAEARRKAGYTSAKSAAELFGWAVSSYVQHENGTRGIPKDKAPVYARRYNTTAEWLLYGEGEGPTGPALPSVEQLAAMLALAQSEILPPTPYGDWPQAVASSLHGQLVRFQSTGLAPLDGDGEPATSRGKVPRSVAPTKPTSPEGSRTS